MTTTLILSLGITLALAVLLVPAIGTVVFAQNMSGLGGNMTGNLSGMAGNASEKLSNMTEKAGGMIGNLTK
jgi:hypothetical protein